MPYSGTLDTRPILDVIQIVAYSQLSGILSVKGPDSNGLIIFENGNVVCAYSPTSLSLLVKAAKETDEGARLSIRRIQVLTALRELFDLGKGEYRFVRKSERVPELEGLDIGAFYEAGPLDTGDLLVVLEKAMDAESPEIAPAAPREAQSSGAELRRYPRFGPIVIPGQVRAEEATLDGYLTNLSAGGTFFHAEDLLTVGTICEVGFDLPWELGACKVRAKVVWVRSEGGGAKRGVGLSFLSFGASSKERIRSYLERFEALATDLDFEA